jgi:hypothetical protein
MDADIYTRVYMCIHTNLTGMDAHSIRRVCLRHQFDFEVYGPGKTCNNVCAWIYIYIYIYIYTYTHIHIYMCVCVNTHREREREREREFGRHQFDFQAHGPCKTCNNV